jgi:hypothetical protein
VAGYSAKAAECARSDIFRRDGDPLDQPAYCGIPGGVFAQVVSGVEQQLLWGISMGTGLFQETVGKYTPISYQPQLCRTNMNQAKDIRKSLSSLYFRQLLY